MDKIQSTPTFRVRINHSHTLKEGWRVSETTVEATFPIDAGTLQIDIDLAAWMRSAHELGLQEAVRRNGWGTEG